MLVLHVLRHMKEIIYMWLHQTLLHTNVLLVQQKYKKTITEIQLHQDNTSDRGSNLINHYTTRGSTYFVPHKSYLCQTKMST